MSAEDTPEFTTTVSHRHVARNASIYFLGQILTWLINILTMSVIPRALGKTAMGELAVAMTINMTISLCLMVGGEMLLSKEIGRDRTRAAHLIGVVLGLRIALIPVFVLISRIAFQLLKVNDQVWQLWPIITAATAVSLLADPLRAVLLGWEEAKQVSALDIVFALVPLATIPLLRYGIVTQAYGLLASNVIVMLLRWRWIAKYIAVRPTVHLVYWKEVIRGGLPFVINSLMLQLMGFASIFMVRHFAGYGDAGICSQASRLFGTFLFVPNAIGMALLPSLARLAEAEPDELRLLQSRVLVLLMVLSLPVTVTIMILAAPISHLLYGSTDFAAMPMVLQVYALAVVPLYIVTTMYQFLVAQNRGGAWTGFLLVSLLLYMAFAAFLIPWTLARYGSGAVGAVGATFLSELFSAIFAFVLLGNNPLTPETIGRILRTLLATLGMAGILWLTRGVFVLVPMTAGFLVFALLAWKLNVLSPEEQAKITGMIRGKLARR